ncbi:MAG: hypothetical protein DMF98_02875 [Acidobacteria bacterium]|nr:MAG: hypothetical protein DMF98_02875 [Acidobacteriota bacterium]
MGKRREFRPQLLFLATCGLAAALTAACGNKADQTAANPDNRPVGTSGSASTGNAMKPIDVTGCLQKADGSYVLTEINKPNPNAAPTTKKGDGSVVEREQMHAAQHAYRLTAEKDDDLEKLVGKQVKVSGTLTEASDLTARDDRRANDLSVGTSGNQDKNHDRKPDRARIRTGDLASVDVTSIQPTAGGCGKGR